MSTVNIDLTKRIGKMKVMHAVNNGPCVSSGVQTRGNQDDYRAARFKYARNHDAAFHAGYGGEHTVDIHAIFPNFDADVPLPESGICHFQTQAGTVPKILHRQLLQDDS